MECTSLFSTGSGIRNYYATTRFFLNTKLYCGFLGFPPKVVKIHSLSSISVEIYYQNESQIFAALTLIV